MPTCVDLRLRYSGTEGWDLACLIGIREKPEESVVLMRIHKTLCRVAAEASRKGGKPPSDPASADPLADANALNGAIQQAVFSNGRWKFFTFPTQIHSVPR